MTAIIRRRLHTCRISCKSSIQHIIRIRVTTQKQSRIIDRIRFCNTKLLTITTHCQHWSHYKFVFYHTINRSQSIHFFKAGIELIIRRETTLRSISYINLVILSKGKISLLTINFIIIRTFRYKTVSHTFIIHSKFHIKIISKIKIQSIIFIGNCLF